MVAFQTAHPSVLALWRHESGRRLRGLRRGVCLAERCLVNKHTTQAICVCGHGHLVHNENGCLVDDAGGIFMQPCWCMEFVEAYCESEKDAT